MFGTMVVIKALGGTEVKTFNRRPDLQELQEKVGGFIEAVPDFTRYSVRQKDGTRIAQECIVYCNEQGKLGGMQINRMATEEWGECLTNKGASLNDSLVGDVIVLYGDREFMNAL